MWLVDSLVNMLGIFLWYRWSISRFVQINLFANLFIVYVLAIRKGFFTDFADQLHNDWFPGNCPSNFKSNFVHENFTIQFCLKMKFKVISKYLIFPKLQMYCCLLRLLNIGWYFTNFLFFLNFTIYGSNSYQQIIKN